MNTFRADNEQPRLYLSDYFRSIRFCFTAEVLEWLSGTTNDDPYMLGWLKELRKLAKRITAVIDELRKPNPVPEGTTNNISSDSNL